MKKNLLYPTICLLICLSLVLLAGCVSQATYQSLQTDYSTLQKQYNNLQSELSNLQTELNTTQDKLSSIQIELSVAQAKLELYQDTGIEVYSDIQPDVMINWDGDSSLLLNNATSHNPTWSELMAFITRDNTDSLFYGLPNLCGWFAEQVHNNAEKAGIRAAFVVINFKKGEGHALNAFNTTDRGLVYIDCTGQGIQAVYPPFLCYIVIGDTDSDDKVAYLEIGKPLGMITLGCPYGLSYADYEQWKEDVERMRERFEATTTNSKMYQLKEESDHNLGSFWEEDPTEKVKSIEIYW